MIRDIIKRKPASKGKGRVKPAATGFRAWFDKLDREIRAIVFMVAIWLILCVFLFLNSTSQDSIDLDRYYDDIRTEETERLT